MADKRETIERTLVLLKPDAVQRGLMGEIITRFEKAGMKIVGLKMKWVDMEKASQHYEDVGVRRGEKVKKVLVDFISSGPVLAMAIEGVDAVENVRMMAGPTEPKAAPPGTIRGDYSHVSFKHADLEGKAVKNIIHSSGNKEEAEKEIWLWFNEDEIYDYKTVHEALTF